jgi:hypothetical protein
MADIDFQKSFSKLRKDVENFASSAVRQYGNEAKADALELVEDMKENLKTWTLQLADNKLSKKDYQYLVLGQKELIEMNALKQTGLSLIKVNEFKHSLFNVITNSLISSV